MSVAVLIPWRDTNCAHRTRALEYVTARYAEEYPDWQVAVGRHETGPWVKAHAVADALSQTQAETLIVADADVWCEGLPGAVRSVQDGAPWAIPHRGINRLSERATGQWLAGEHLSYLSSALDLCERTYLGVEGGGIVVLRRDVYDACPLDPRFAGWGQEDDAWGFALRALYGPPVRLKSPLIHFFHPPQERATRSFGSLEGRDLRKRYARARNDPGVMRALVSEAMAARVSNASRLVKNPAGQIV